VRGLDWWSYRSCLANQRGRAETPTLLRAEAADTQVGFAQRQLYGVILYRQAGPEIAEIFLRFELDLYRDRVAHGRQNQAALGKALHRGGVIQSEARALGTDKIDQRGIILVRIETVSHTLRVAEAVPRSIRIQGTGSCVRGTDENSGVGFYAIGQPVPVGVGDIWIRSGVCRADIEPGVGFHPIY
jgi:hypothetical protein